ncbi:Hypothetical predicted protein [Cloeon dipterum]|uniref:Poly [ADP-ribose] polymerase n=1 Tax=Cloeon dipterum TaxID=197152 RepID=A0A8S1E013_9INSE|nr:Hypothetical predicted protein [Cloeon dipterum]
MAYLINQLCNQDSGYWNFEESAPRLGKTRAQKLVTITGNLTVLAAEMDSIELEKWEPEFLAVSDRLRLPSFDLGSGLLRHFPLRQMQVQRVHKIKNEELEARFGHQAAALGAEGACETLLHGSPAAWKIAAEGFDVGRSESDNLFGRGVYLTPDPATANKYAFGKLQPCPQHSDTHCVRCVRLLVVADCLLGRPFLPSLAASTPLPWPCPPGFDSIVADPATNPAVARFLQSPEVVVFRNEQLMPRYVVEYTISVYSRDEFAKIVGQQMRQMQQIPWSHRPAGVFSSAW